MNRYMPKMAALLAAMTVATAGTASAVEGPAVATSPVANRTIGYVMTDLHWAIYQSKDGKEECPQGFNDGPREQFKMLFPDDGTKRKLVDTQLARESLIWHPTLTPEQFTFKEAGGKTAPGLNLDGKVGPNDFTSPEGEKGIDNNLYRVIGCVAIYRGPDSLFYHFNNKFMQQYAYDRVLLELTNVDSLVNDDDVTVTIYRGLDSLLTDATGDEFLAGGTQRVDMRWGKEFIRKMHGKIVDGVLTTEGSEMSLPAMAAFEDPTAQHFLDARFKLKLTPDKADGLLAGYVDVEAFYRQLVRSWSTHHESYGQLSAPSLYRAIHRLADGYPDPKTGVNTGISGAMEMKFTQVFIKHPAQPVAANDTPAQTATAQAARH